MLQRQNSSLVYIHLKGKEFLYISRACIVIKDLADPHKHEFLREHNDQITCLIISQDGKLITSRQRGDNSDLIKWSYQYLKQIKMIYFLKYNPHFFLEYYCSILYAKIIENICQKWEVFLRI
jgi:hypothetical protein